MLVLHYSVIVKPFLLTNKQSGQFVIIWLRLYRRKLQSIQLHLLGCLYSLYHLIRTFSGPRRRCSVPKTSIQLMEKASIVSLMALCIFLQYNILLLLYLLSLLTNRPVNKMIVHNMQVVGEETTAGYTFIIIAVRCPYICMIYDKYDAVFAK